MSKAITKKTDERPTEAEDLAGPSLKVEEEPTLARVCALIGATLCVIGLVVLWLTTFGGRTNMAIGPGWATFLLFVGVCGLLLHAVVEKDPQFHLVYLAVAAAVLVAGVALCLVPYPTHLGDLFGPGFLALVLGLLFLLAFLRNEPASARRDNVQLALLGVGAVLAVVGLVGGAVSPDFLTPCGLLLALLGLVYMLAFVGARGSSDDLSVRVGWVVLAAGALTFLVALGRSVFPPLFVYFKWTTTSGNYFFPYGLALMVIGAVYAASSYLTCSDAPLAVLTRRELGAFFYSPMAYLLVFGFTVIAWISFGLFFSALWGISHPPPGQPPQPLIEPIVQNYIFSLFPAVAMIFVVPVLTMRLVSEEKRLGTLEMLLTAPVEEPTVVLSKFIAGWVMFVVTWVPFFLFLIPLAAAGAPFDYRPLLSFILSLMVAGAGMVAMGLFFSTLTGNQLVSAVITFAGMLCLTAVYVASDYVSDLSASWGAVLKHMSFLHSWLETLQGKVTPNIGLVFFSSMAVFFLFLSVKVLESRKWW